MGMKINNIERGADGRQRCCAGAGRATGSLPGALIGGVLTGRLLPVVRPRLGVIGIRDSRFGVRDGAFPKAESRALKARHRAFTLTELLIVIALIVLLLALAVPAFNFITGGRSVDGAQNVVSAMLGRARARAIESERYAGVAFYLDPATGRTTMTMVVQRDGDLNVGGEDPYDNYKGWKTGAAYTPGQEVIAVVADGAINTQWPTPSTPPPATENRLVVRKFVCIQGHTAAAGNRPPNATYWGTAQQKFVDFDIDAESETIPVGVGVQLVNDTKSNATPPNTDRYVRTGVILFDGRGRFDSVPYGIRKDGGWGTRLGLSNDIDVGLYSQLGLTLYELAPFKDQPAGDGTENDLFYQIPSYGPAPANEVNEEDWLDKNGVLLSINRYNGTLVRGE